MPSWTVLETTEGIQFKIKVLPRAAKNEISGIQGDALKLRLTAPPVDGAANEACVQFLAGLLNISKKAVSIVNGHTSQHKIIRIEGIKKADLLKCVEIRH